MSGLKSFFLKTEVTVAGALLTALTLFGLLIFQHLSWRNFTANGEQVYKDVSTMREEATLAHLRLEESLMSESPRMKDYAIQLFEKAIARIDVLIAGKNQLIEGLPLHERNELNKRLTAIRSRLIILKEDGIKRWDYRNLPQVDPDNEEAIFNEMFSNLLSITNSAEKIIGSVLAKKAASLEKQFIAVTVIWLVIVGIGSVMLFAVSRSRENFMAALEKSNKSLEEAQKVANMGAWDLDIVSNKLEWSNEIYRIFGVEREHFGATYEAFLGFVAEDDREKVKTAVENSLNNGDPYKIQHRIVQPNGVSRLVLEKGEVFYDFAGKPLRMIGTVQDITDIKAAEDQLALASKIFENAIEGVIVTDTAGVIQFVNPAVMEITGYSASELVGLTPRSLRSQRHDKEFYKKMWGDLLTNGEWSGEIWNRRKSGEAYPEWLNICAIKDDTGKIIKFVSIFHDISQLKKSEEKIQHQIYHDALTGLPNRALFDDRLTQAISTAHREGKKLAMHFIGLDRFKNINETLGHLAGDKVLQEVSARFSTIVREGDTLARFGGDEFVILMIDMELEQEAASLAMRAINALTAPITIGEQELFLTASVGVALYPSDGTDTGSLIRNSQIALRRAKDEGKNTYQLYAPSMNTKTHERLSLESDLRRALDRGEFVVFYQPKVNIATGEIIGMESLIRWVNPTRGMVSPMDFIPLAEETGLIAPIGKWVLEESLRRTKLWHDAGHKNLAVAVNISALQFRKKDLLESIKTAISISGLDASFLNIELTESVVMREVEAAIGILHEIKEMGVKISIDDFGTGYSSLNYLKKFPIDYLKVDKSFINDITTDPDAAAISSIIISMSHLLNIKVVAEGVETIEQLNFLRENRCDEIQGFLFSKPLPGLEFERLVASGKKLIGGGLKPTAGM